MSKTKLRGHAKWGKFYLLGDSLERYGYPVYSDGELVGFEQELSDRPPNKFRIEWMFFHKIETISWYKMLTEQDVFAAKLAGKI